MSAGLSIKHQGLLEKHLVDIFPHYNILNNAKKLVAIKNPLTDSYLEVDVWVPEINLCFEYQDDYHYKSAWYSQIPLHFTQEKDNTKRNKLLERGNTLVAVPYWWDGTLKSLQSSISFLCPELNLPHKHIEIPVNLPPQLSLDDRPLMLASFPDDSIGLEILERNSWWVGEKWDGIRCSWNPSDRQLYSRYSAYIELHPAVMLSFGNLEFDGELWCGRSCFHEAQNFLTFYWDVLNSSFLRFVCFDEASAQTHGRPFEARYEMILLNVQAEHPVVMIAPRFLSTGETTLLHALESITYSGGEGLILRRSQSFYIPGRSRFLFKIKASDSDQEALVVNVANDSIKLQLPNGTTFIVPKKDCLFPQEAARGDIVTFSTSRRFQYKSLKSLFSGVPSNPIVHCIRSDLAWEDVLRNSLHPIRSNETKSARKSQENSVVQLDQRSQYYSHKVTPKEEPDATWKLMSKRREYFDNYARSKGVDPLNPVFWYDVTARQLISYNNSYSAVVAYNGGILSKTLVQLYPDIGLQKSRFNTQKQWKLESERKAYFDSFALAKGMDPLNPFFWYGIKKRELLKYHKGYKKISEYLGGKLSSILMQVYPNIGLKKNFFAEQYWKLHSTKRTFFDSFAASKGMNPQNAQFWHSVTIRDLMNYNPGAFHIIREHGGKLHATLAQVYPGIGLQSASFNAAIQTNKMHVAKTERNLDAFKVNKQTWKQRSEMRARLDHMAVSKGMDPLNPNFWHSIPKHEILKFSGVASSTARSTFSILSEVYPDIGLQKSKLKR